MQKTDRLKENKVFKYILKKGTYAKGKYIVVHIAKQNQIHKNYFGVCVSKKNGNSVARNKLKRWARELYQQEEAKLQTGYDIVILYKKLTTLDTVEFLDIKKDLCHCLGELDLYEKK